MTELEGCIRFWEATLKGKRFMLEPSTIVLVEATIKHLKELLKLREKEG